MCGVSFLMFLPVFSSKALVELPSQKSSTVLHKVPYNLSKISDALCRNFTKWYFF
jgi:hypothetical protein